MMSEARALDSDAPRVVLFWFGWSTVQPDEQSVDSWKFDALQTRYLLVARAGSDLRLGVRAANQLVAFMC